MAHDFIEMLWWRGMSGTHRLMALMAAVIALLVLADAVIAVRLFVPQAFSSVPTAAATHSGHPCNHGFYVSQAAHAKKGGAYVSSIAKSKLGKDGNCTAPLPAH